MRGRKPKPTTLADLHGNPSKHAKTALEGRRALEPVNDRLEQPDFFSESQTRIWNEAIENAPPGVLRRIDGYMLQAWVVACDLHRQAAIQQSKTSLLMRVPQKDGGKAIPQQSPLLAIINRQAVIMARIAEQMGFTPVARPRIYGVAQVPMSGETGLGSKAIAGRSMSLDDYIANAPARPNLH